jgi:predicted branched-subunit amino acid permease
MVFSVKTFLLIIVLPIWQYYFSYFIGLVIWNLKSKIRIIPYLFQIIILLICILLLSKNMVNILILIMLGFLLPISIGIKKLTETLSKERILKRSI